MCARSRSTSTYDRREGNRPMPNTILMPAPAARCDRGPAVEMAGFGRRRSATRRRRRRGSNRQGEPEVEAHAAGRLERIRLRPAPVGFASARRLLRRRERWKRCVLDDADDVPAAHFHAPFADLVAGETDDTTAVFGRFLRGAGSRARNTELSRGAARRDGGGDAARPQRVPDGRGGGAVPGRLQDQPGPARGVRRQARDRHAHHRAGLCRHRRRRGHGRACGRSSSS